MTRRNLWMARARRLAVRRILANWLDLFLPALLGVSVTAAVILLILRRMAGPTHPIWIYAGGALVVVAVASWVISRRRPFTTKNALVHLEDIGRLHNRLTAANAGVGEWPEPQKIRDPIRWNWPRICGFIGLSVCLLLGAARLPMPQQTNRKGPIDPPLAWSRVDSWLVALDQSKLFEPEALEKLREQLDEIRKQPEEKWYDQSSLEAGDSLRQRTEDGLRSGLLDLKTADAALNAADKNAAGAPPDDLKALNDSLQKSLQGLETGTLPLNKELLGNLKKLDASKLRQVSAAQLAEMREKLKAGAKVCEKCVGPTARVTSELFDGDKKNGGPGGGGSPAPLTVKQDPTNLKSKTSEGVSNEDVSRAALGDVLAVSKGKHEVDKDNESNRAVSGGAIQSNGNGGEAVWKEALTPDEREVLQRFFK